MSPKYKLTYFDSTGRGELSRWIFAYAGQEYEDVRINKADWPTLKANYPNGKLPILEFDGILLTQSIAIARFLARRFGLVGKDDIESAQADSVVDYVLDIINKELFPIVLEQDKEKQTALKEELKVSIHPYLKALERDLKANNNGDGFFVGDQPTWADFIVAYVVVQVSGDQSRLDDYPLLKAHTQRVYNLKGIKEWLAERPVPAKI